MRVSCIRGRAGGSGSGMVLVLEAAVEREGLRAEGWRAGTKLSQPPRPGRPAPAAVPFIREPQLYLNHHNRALLAMRNLRPLYRALSRPAVHPSCRCLHSTAVAAATPLPHPSVPQPPPEPPAPSPASPHDRVARKRQQANLLQQAQAARKDASKSSSPLQRRFWKTVSVEETADGQGLQILLDKRPVRTAARQILVLPKQKHALATAVALEWDLLVSAQQALKQTYIPLTSLVSRAIDLDAADKAGDKSLRNNVVTFLMRYLSTDTLLCWTPETNAHDQTAGKLREKQIQVAQDIIGHLTTHLWPGIHIQPTLDPNSILPLPQPEETQQVVRSWVSALPAFELAALERGVLASKSLLVPVRLIVEWGNEWSELRKLAGGGSRFGIEEAAESCSLEVRWQTGMWGEVEDTHDVEKEDLRRQLGSCILLIT